MNHKKELTGNAILNISSATFATILVGGLLSSQAHAGAWVQNVGQLSLNYGLAISESREQVTFDGKINPVGPLNYSTHTLSLSYGLLNNLTVYGVIPYGSVKRVDNVPADHTGFQDGRIGVLYNILNEFKDSPLTVSTKFEYKFPLSDYPKDRGASLGDQQRDFEAELLVGKFFDVLGKTSYVEAGMGYRFRETVPDDVFMHLELGVYFIEEFSARVWIEQVDAKSGIGLGSNEFKAGFKDLNQPGDKLIRPYSLTEKDFTRAGIGFGSKITEKVNVGIYYLKNIKTLNTDIATHYGLTIGYNF